MLPHGATARHGATRPATDRCRHRNACDSVKLSRFARGARQDQADAELGRNLTGLTEEDRVIVAAVPSVQVTICRGHKSSAETPE